MSKNKNLRVPLWLVIVSFFVSFGILSISMVRVNQVKAQIEAKEDLGASISGELLEVKEEAVSYYLPYPGILPDHPMYWMKMIRDRVQLWLTTGNRLKAERLLLYADKRLGAGWALVEGNKTSLGITTLTKAEKYLERSVFIGVKLGEDTEDKKFKNKLGKAALKHRQVLNIVKNMVDEKEMEMIEAMIDMRIGEVSSNALSGVQTKKVVVKLDFGEEPYEIEVVAKTALQALEMAGEENDWEIKIKTYDFGSLVEEVEELANTTEKSWIYFVNGKSGEVAADKMELKAGDVVEWKYIKPIF